MAGATFMVESFVTGPVAVIRPMGWLTDDAQGEVEEQFRALSARGHRRFVVDMSALHVVDQTGMKVLLDCRRELARRGGCVVLAALSGSARRMLFGCNLAGLFPVRDSVEEARELAGRSTPSGRWRPVEG